MIGIFIIIIFNIIIIITIMIVITICTFIGSETSLYELSVSIRLSIGRRSVVGLS